MAFLTASVTAFSPTKGPPGTACMMKKVSVMTIQMVKIARMMRFRMYLIVFGFISFPLFPDVSFNKKSPPVRTAFHFVSRPSGYCCAARGSPRTRNAGRLSVHRFNALMLHPFYTLSVGKTSIVCKNVRADAISFFLRV